MPRIVEPTFLGDARLLGITARPLPFWQCSLDGSISVR
jgi:hypothetical protein